GTMRVGLLVARRAQLRLLRGSQRAPELDQQRQVGLLEIVLERHHLVRLGQNLGLVERGRREQLGERVTGRLHVPLDLDSHGLERLDLRDVGLARRLVESEVLLVLHDQVRREELVADRIFLGGRWLRGWWLRLRVRDGCEGGEEDEYSHGRAPWSRRGSDA